MSDTEKKITDYTHAHKIQINYKSGKSVTMWFLDFKLNKNMMGEFVSASWLLAHANTMVFDMGLSNIESVFRLDVKKFNHKEFGWNDEGQSAIA